eukprot:sb/3461040/
MFLFKCLSIYRRSTRKLKLMIVSQMNQVFTRLQMKVEEVRMDRQLQNYIEKLKPLLRSVQMQKHLKENMMKIHKAGRRDTVGAQKLTIQHICNDIVSVQVLDSSGPFELYVLPCPKINIIITGLKYVEGNELTAYISFDANEFYLDLKFPPNDGAGGAVVTLVNKGQPETQPEISETLKSGDFEAFTAHLKGYIGVFNIPTEPRVRTALLSALRALERDLLSMVSSPDLTRETINTSPVGHVIGSRGGLGARILYHHSNGDTAAKLEEDVLIKESREVVIGVECAAVNQLATEPLHITSNEFKQRDQSNSEYLEACFVARLGTPLVITVDRMNKLLKKLGSRSQIKTSGIQTTLLSLLLPKGESKVLTHEKLKHDYYLPQDTTKAITVHRIPFDHPTQIPFIVDALRQQELINTLILSCKYKSDRSNENSSPSNTKTTPTPDRITVDISLVSGDSIDHIRYRSLLCLCANCGHSRVSVQMQKHLKENMMKIHKAGRRDTVGAQKLTIQHICNDIVSVQVLDSSGPFELYVLPCPKINIIITGLKYVEGNELTAYISFDANEFYLDLKFPPNDGAGGAVVTLVNKGQPETQPEISETLKSGDFEAFTAHLKGYIGVFNIPTEPRVRTALLSALRALERDLLSMVSSPDLTRETINTSPVGHVIGSRGGLGARILYHHSNGDTAAKLEEDVLIKESREVVIGVECAAVNQLATEPLHITSNEFKQRDQSNSEYLEACFVARLGTPLVITVDRMNKLLKKLGSRSQIKTSGIQTTLLSLLLPKGESKVLTHEKLKHDYYLPQDTTKAITVHRIPFDHPTQIPFIVDALRQQELINTLILSCKYKSDRSNENSSPSNTKTTPTPDRITVDISLVSGDSIECMFAHPRIPTLSVVTFDIAPSSVSVLTADTLKRGALEKVCSRFFSIPLTLHGLLRILVHHHEKGVTVPKITQARGEGRKEYEFKITDTSSTDTPPQLETPKPQPAPLPPQQQVQPPPPQQPAMQPPPQLQQPPAHSYMGHPGMGMGHMGQGMPQQHGGMPQMMAHHGMPPMSQGMPPPNMSGHQMPPMSQQGMMHAMGMPQMSHQMPPMSHSQGMPPMSHSQGMPPMSQGMQQMPQISQGMPQMSQGMQQMPQMSQGMSHMSHVMPQIRTPPAMSSPYDNSKLPSPPDIIAQKRKRPIMDGGDGSDMKKPAKLVKMGEPPGIPSLSPAMGGLAPRLMRPVGPPTKTNKQCVTQALLEKYLKICIPFQKHTQHIYQSVSSTKNLRNFKTFTIPKNAQNCFLSYHSPISFSHNNILAVPSLSLSLSPIRSVFSTRSLAGKISKNLYPLSKTHTTHLPIRV